MIEFETPKPIAQLDYALKTVAENMMRPFSRYYDDHEHEIPWDYITFMHAAMASMGAGSLAPDQKEKTDAEGKPRPRDWLPAPGAYVGNAFLGRYRYVPGDARGWVGCGCC